jgi:RsiW-degrading membrane proteinase PrsW (M82 family)
MKLFPSDEFRVELQNESQIAMAKLKSNTKLTKSLVSEWGVKEDFLGQIDNNGFKVILSLRGVGAFCVLTGKFQNKIGTLKIHVHKAFRVLITIIMTFPFIGFGIIASQNGLQEAIELLIPFILFLLFIRFVLLGITYKVISNMGLKRLSETIEIKKLK